MKKILLILSILLTILSAEKLDKIVIAGPATNISYPIFRIIESGALKNIAKKIEFKLWKNPDQLRAMIINKEVDFVAVPTNVGAILYNKKQPIKLLNVSIWGLLYVLVRNKEINSLNKLKGKSLVIPWRGDMPDIVIRSIMKKEGLTKKDINLIYVSNPIDAVHQLILRRQNNALLGEPVVSMVLRKAHELYRGIDIQKEWERTFKTESKIPQAGMAVVGKMRNNKKVVEKFEKAYENATIWCKAHPKESAKMIVKYIKMFTPEAIEDSITNVKMNVVRAKDAKNDLKLFFNQLKSENPKIIGGKLPDKEFYY